MLKAITVLLVFQLAGEALSLGLALPVPGPVIGMLLLFAVLVARNATPDYLREGAGNLLTHLSLLFVPAGVGVMTHLDRIRAEFAPIAVSLVASTALTIAVTALILKHRKRLPDVTGAAGAPPAPRDHGAGLS
jgi:holin-like protein